MANDIYNKTGLAEAIWLLPPFDGPDLNVVVDTPRQSRNKYKFDPAAGMFALGGLLTVGHSFPYDFGFIPNTVGGDGDPLDALVLMDEPTFVGCLVKCRLIGGIKAEQSERGGKPERNDRLLAISRESIAFNGIRSLADLNKTLIRQIEHFFISYNEAKGKTFKVLGHFGSRLAVAAVKKGTISNGGKNG
jgi:inorganic pyrophosphatase